MVRSYHEPVLIAVALLAVLLGALMPDTTALGAPSTTIEVRQARAVETGDLMSAEIQLGGLFSDRVRETLERALPASLMVTVDVWRDRAGWFDQLVDSRSQLYRIRYDAWGEDFDVARGTEEQNHIGTLTDVADSLMRPLFVPLFPRAKLTAGNRYYLVVTASLKPLTADDLHEIEDFLNHQSHLGHARPGPFPSGSLAHLPQSVFSVLTTLSGFGDEIATVRTPEFAPR
jgi:hypothetical protein